MTRRTLLWIGCGATALLLGLTILGALAPREVREGFIAASGFLGTIGTVVAAIAAFQAATASRNAAASSSAAAELATQALALHRTNAVTVHLTPEFGTAGQAWTWYVIPKDVVGSESRLVRDITLEWTVNGQLRSSRREELANREVWKVSVEVPDLATAEQVRAAVPQVRSTWQDEFRTVLWDDVFTLEEIHQPTWSPDGYATLTYFEDSRWPSPQAQAPRLSSRGERIVRRVG